MRGPFRVQSQTFVQLHERASFPAECGDEGFGADVAPIAGQLDRLQKGGDGVRTASPVQMGRGRAIQTIRSHARYETLAIGLRGERPNRCTGDRKSTRLNSSHYRAARMPYYA